MAYPYLSKHLISEVENSSPHSEIVTAKSNETAQDVLDRLNKNNILSVPIVDEKTGAFTDAVNIIDLLTLFAFQPVFNSFDTDAKLSELKTETLTTLEADQKKVLQTPVGALVGLSLEGKRLWTFDDKEPLTKLLDAFSVGVHRVLVSHKEGEKTTYTHVSQTDVLRFLKVQSYKRKSPIRGAFLKTLKDLKLGSTPVAVLPSTSTAISGWRSMLTRNELTALPVVDSKKAIIDTLSTSDFRGIGIDNFKDTLLPVTDFLKKHRGEVSVVTATTDEYLATVVDKLLLNGVHRAWVVNAENQPVGVVTLTDIIKQFSIYTAA